jgi:hypothetical protein
VPPRLEIAIAVIVPWLIIAAIIFAIHQWFDGLWLGTPGASS